MVASPACPTPRDREIGYVSSSFSLRAVRASGRGEAVRAHVERYPYRWASRELVSTCCSPVSGALGVNLLCTGAWVLTAFDQYCNAWASLLLTGAWVLRNLIQGWLVFAWVSRDTT